MTADRAAPHWARMRLAAWTAWQAVAPPWRVWRFWVVQGGVLLVVLVDEVVLDLLHVRLPFGIPTYASTALLLVPVVYAALSFGVRGAVATAAWATVLLLPDRFFFAPPSRTNTWGEVLHLVIINAVAVVVGQRVEHERAGRAEAERALAASAAAQARYSALFEQQHAPVLVVNDDGAQQVVEANTAASTLFGRPVIGCSIRQLLGVDLADVVAGLVLEPLTLRTDAEEHRLFTLRGCTVQAGAQQRLVQLLLLDVTDEHHRRREQQAYASHLLAVQEEERQRLAQELHDDPMQTLMFLVRSLGQLADHPDLPPHLADPVRRGSALTGEVTDSLRKVIRGLRPPVLDDLGLAAALRHLTREVGEHTGIRVDLRVTGGPRLAAEQELALYRVAQEALSNAVRHARTRTVHVSLRVGETATILTVTDDGQGFTTNPSHEPRDAGRGGLGLIGMRERLTWLGGTLRIRSRVGRGTTVQARLPHAPASSEERRPRRPAAAR